MSESDPIRRQARRRKLHERATNTGMIRARISADLKTAVQRQAIVDRITVSKLIVICMQGFVERDPGMLALIEQSKRESAQPPKPTRPANGMFSKAEIQEIWKEMGGNEDV